MVCAENAKVIFFDLGQGIFFFLLAKKLKPTCVHQTLDFAHIESVKNRYRKNQGYYNLVIRATAQTTRAQKSGIWCMLILYLMSYGRRELFCFNSCFVRRAETKMKPARQAAGCHLGILLESGTNGFDASENQNFRRILRKVFVF